MNSKHYYIISRKLSIQLLKLISSVKTENGEKPRNGVNVLLFGGLFQISLQNVKCKTSMISNEFHFRVPQLLEGKEKKNLVFDLRTYPFLP